MLNIKDFTTALEIISKSHSTELAINIGMTTEFNSQWDHSNYQSLYQGYNLDMYDGQDEYPDIISCATGDLIGKLINKLDDHFEADYDINRGKQPNNHGYSE